MNVFFEGEVSRASWAWSCGAWGCVSHLREKNKEMNPFIWCHPSNDSSLAELRGHAYGAYDTFSYWHMFYRKWSGDNILVDLES